MDDHPHRTGKNLQRSRREDIPGADQRHWKYRKALVNAAGPVQGAGAIEASRAITALGPEARSRILDGAQAIKRKYDNLNLSVWGRGLSRMATRLALLVCGDLLRVGRAVAEEEGPSALDDLLTFALSLEHMDLRQELGLTVR